MPLSTRVRNLVAVVICFYFSTSRDETQRSYSAQNSQVAASCEGIVDTIMQGCRLRLRSRLTRVAPPLRRLNRGVNIFLERIVNSKETPGSHALSSGA